MAFQVGNYIIEEPILNILEQVKLELTNGKLDKIENKGDYIRVTCPVHSDGMEHNPSCSVYCGNNGLEQGTWNCFTCGSHGKLSDFIGKCFDESKHFGERWLIEHYGNTFVKPTYNLTDIVLDNKVETKTLNESILNTFESYHPYMTKRGISDEVIKEFELRYDPLSRCIVFPVRDKHGKLVALTRRSVDTKKFIIDKDFNKDNIYLLYDILRNNTKEVYVVESQINALVLRSWGYPSIALFGAGTTYTQMQELNKTGVKHFILCYDPDPAGEKGTLRFIKYLRKDIFCDIVKMPEGKDVADLTKEEFIELLK